MSIPTAILAALNMSLKNCLMRSQVPRFSRLLKPLSAISAIYSSVASEKFQPFLAARAFIAARVARLLRSYTFLRKLSKCCAPTTLRSPSWPTTSCRTVATTSATLSALGITTTTSPVAVSYQPLARRIRFCLRASLSVSSSTFSTMRTFVPSFLPVFFAAFVMLSASVALRSAISLLSALICSSVTAPSWRACGSRPASFTILSTSVGVSKRFTFIAPVITQGSVVGSTLVRYI